MYEELINRSRFSERIKHLLANQELANAKLGKWQFGDVVPDCFGSMIYLIGGNQRVIDLWQKEGKKVNDTSAPNGDWVVIPNIDRQGYLGSSAIELFMKELKRGKSLDSMAALYWHNNEFAVPSCAFLIQHTALFIGRQNGENIVFHQPKRGASFEVGSLEKYMAEIKYSEPVKRFYNLN